MKLLRIKYLFVSILLVGSLAFNVTNAAAQDEIITAQAPDVYQSGVLKNIGAAVPGLAPLQFLNVGFYAPADHPFTSTSNASLAAGDGFFLTDTVIGTGPNGPNTYLRVTINFLPPANQIYSNALTVSVGGGVIPFTLPLTGIGVPFLVDPITLQDFGFVPAGSTSATKTLTLTALGANPNFVNYSFSNGSSSAFSASSSRATSTTFNVNIQFKPTQQQAYTDTLIIGYANTSLVYKVPLRGSGAFVIPSVDALYFNKVAAGATKPLNLSVQVVSGHGVSIDLVTVTNSGFTVTPAPGWDNSTGGILTIKFSPTATIPYNAKLRLIGTGFNLIEIPLNGVGAPKPVITSNPTSYPFGTVPAGTTVNSDTIRVTLTNHLNQLTDPGTFSFADNDEIFKVVSVYRDATAPLEPNVVWVILSFSPTATESYTDTLIVKADYANSYSIPLSGTGAPALRGATQATAISKAETAVATTLSVKYGDITVSGTSAGSSVKVYNLQGQLLKTQQVSAEVEVLKTAAWPKGIYVVTVDGDQQEILKQKVVL
jgi:hypothetical protein